jgi:hypothetical protein
MVVFLMVDTYLGDSLLSDSDLDFVVEALSPEPLTRFRVKEIMKEDEYLRGAFLSDAKVFTKLMEDERVFLKISPQLFFEVLLRKAIADMEEASLAIAKAGLAKATVSGTNRVIEFLKRDKMVPYLADMLSSFTGAGSQIIAFRTTKGVWRRVRLNDLDIRGLINLSKSVDDGFKFNFYKRAGDLCLFVSGVFSGDGETESADSLSGQEAAETIRGLRPADYEEDGEKYYRLTAAHPAAAKLGLADILQGLHQNFGLAQKSLKFITQHYLRYRRNAVFT